MRIRAQPEPRTVRILSGVSEHTAALLILLSGGGSGCGSGHPAVGRGGILPRRLHDGPPPAVLPGTPSGRGGGLPGRGGRAPPGRRRPPAAPVPPAPRRGRRRRAPPPRTRRTRPRGRLSSARGTGVAAGYEAGRLKERNIFMT